MSNIDKIRQEIERLENEGAINKQKASENNDIESYVAWGQQEAIMGVLIRFIDSLQQERPEEDLEKEIDKVWNNGLSDELAGPHNNFDICARLARHFYKLGKQSKLRNKEAWVTRAKKELEGEK